MTSQVFNRSMIAGERKGFTVDVSQISVAEWEPGAIFDANALVSPTAIKETGFIYLNNGPEGQTGPTEPTWIVPAGQVVQDGSLTWTAVVPPASGQDSVASVGVLQINPPDGALGVSIQISSTLTAEVVVSGGTTGNTYTVNAVITMASTAVYIAQLVVQVN
jgi:hypothetical protein